MMEHQRPLLERLREATGAIGRGTYTGPERRHCGAECAEFAAADGTCPGWTHPDDQGHAAKHAERNR